MATKQKVRAGATTAQPGKDASLFKWPTDPSVAEKASYIFEDPDGPAWHVSPDGTAYALAIFRGKSGQVTMVDYAYALDPTMAAFLQRAFVNGKDFPLSSKLPNGAKIQWFIAREAQPQLEWLKFTGSPASEIIRHQLGIPMTSVEQAVYRTAMQDRFQPEKPAFPNAAVTEATARKDWKQANREGKRLIGAYVKDEDIKAFRAILKSRGTNVQEFLSQVVANEIAAASNPAELDRLARAQVDRFRALLRPSPSN